VFGAFLVLTGIKLFVQRQQASNPADSAVIKLARRLIPATDRLDGEKFFTVENGKRVATPLFMALLLVEATDVVFAVDSIPAIFAVTSDPFIVFTSNIFAILGLRSTSFATSRPVSQRCLCSWAPRCRWSTCTKFRRSLPCWSLPCS
jgi:tellurite resistance protein TerC